MRIEIASLMQWAVVLISLVHAERSNSGWEWKSRDGKTSGGALALAARGSDDVDGPLWGQSPARKQSRRARSRTQHTTGIRADEAKSVDMDVCMWVYEDVFG